MLEETGSSISPQVFNLPLFNLPSVILDNFLDDFIEGGYNVGSSDTPCKEKN